MQQAKFIFPDFRRAGGLSQFFQRREMPLELIIREKRIFKISPRIRTGVATNANPSITIWQSALFENGRQQPRGRERRFSAARRADQRQEMWLTLSSENRSKTNANPSITIWQSALFENGRQQPRGRPFSKRADCQMV